VSPIKQPSAGSKIKRENYTYVAVNLDLVLEISTGIS
jgi:hypothetical protein